MDKPDRPHLRSLAESITWPAFTPIPEPYINLAGNVCLPPPMLLALLSALDAAERVLESARVMHADELAACAGDRAEAATWTAWAGLDAAIAAYDADTKGRA